MKPSRILLMRVLLCVPGVLNCPVVLDAADDAIENEQSISLESVPQAAEMRTRLSESQFAFDVFRGPSKDEGLRFLENHLLQRIGELDATGKLTPEKRTAIEFAGKGEIERVRQKFEAILAKCNELDHTGKGLREDERNQVSKDVGQLSWLVDSLFDRPSSLFRKAVQSQLDSDHMTVYEQANKERRQFEWKTMTMSAVANLDKSVSLTSNQRQQLLVLSHVDNPPRMNGVFREFWFYAKLRKHPPEKVRSLFTDAEWVDVESRLNAYSDAIIEDQYFDADLAEKAMEEYEHKMEMEKLQEDSEAGE